MQRHSPGRRAVAAAVIGFTVLAFGMTAPPTYAGDPTPFTARQGRSLATEAAGAWAWDADLVWIESDEPVAVTGASVRWGYLFYSETRDEARAYSLRNGEIRVASDLAFDFPAPPISAKWIDSGVALAAADDDKGNDFRREHAGELRSMMLVRGLLHPDDPDATTWAVVYDSPSTSGLWVVVDAATGKVVKTWRG